MSHDGRKIVVSKKKHVTPKISQRSATRQCWKWKYLWYQKYPISSNLKERVRARSDIYADNSFSSEQISSFLLRKFLIFNVWTVESYNPCKTFYRESLIYMYDCTCRMLMAQFLLECSSALEVLLGKVLICRFHIGKWIACSETPFSRPDAYSWL